MPLMQLYSDAEQDLGEWERYGKDPETGEIVELRIREIPDSVLRRIAARVYGKKSQVRYKGNDAVVETNRDQNIEVTIQNAAYALTGARRFNVRACDQGAAEQWSELLGIKVEVGKTLQDGKDFVLDSHLEKPGVKDQILRNGSEIVDFVLEKAAARKSAAREGEEDSKS